MTADMRAMLDELMGRDRNLSLVEKEKQMEHWSDPAVCKYHLVKFCPHDLFTNTRADLGPCKFTTHDVKIRESYRTSQRWKTIGYETKFLRFLEGVVDDMERKIKKQHERLEHDERYMKAEQEKADEERNSRLDVLNKEIDEVLEKMAEAGSVGNVDEAQEMMKQVETMRQERETIKSAKVEEPGRKIFLVKQNVPFINEMKHMEVCPICGAFLVVNDTQTRVDAHLSGKQHVGYAMIRDAIKELREEKDKEVKDQDDKRAELVADREKEKEKEESVKKEADAIDKEKEDAEKGKDNEREKSGEVDSRDRAREKSKEKPFKGASIERERSRRDAERYQKFSKYDDALGDKEKDRGKDRDRGKERDGGREKEAPSSRDIRGRERRGRDRSGRRDKSRENSRDRPRNSSKDEKEDKSEMQTEQTIAVKVEGGPTEKVIDDETRKEGVENEDKKLDDIPADQDMIENDVDMEKSEFEKLSEGQTKTEDKDGSERKVDSNEKPSRADSRGSASREVRDRSRERSSRKSRERSSRKSCERSSRMSRERSSRKSRDRSRDKTSRRSRDRSHKNRSKERKRRSRSRDRRRSRSYERKRSRH